MGTTHATYDDVNLVLHLYEIRREERMRQARAWFASAFKAKSLDEFNTLCAPGTDQNANFRMVTSYWEMVASFITADVLNRPLFFQSGREILFVWERIRDLLPTVRKKNGDPAFLKNLEIVAGEYIEWMKANNPGAYEAFSKRVRGA